MRLRTTFTALVLAVAGMGTVHAQQNGSDNNSATQYRQLLDRYCVTCHNQALKTAGLMLDQADVSDVSKSPELWERVVTKLSLRAMPPVGIPMRPHESDYQGFLSYLRDELDQLAETDPHPGRPPIHRLNRTEYANAIEDLLAIEIDAEALLPPDNVGEGFDNIAEVLAVSPLLMERYMFAAGRISRMAVGPASMEPASETYQVSRDFLQRDRMGEEQSFGSRGGTAVQHRFPLDGEYTIDIELQANLEGYIRGLRDEHTLIVRLDHQRVGSLTIGGEVHGRSGPLFTGNQVVQYSGDPDQVDYEFTADDKLRLRFPAKAGDHLVGVAFTRDNSKRTGIRTPQLTLGEIQSYKGGVPAVAGITVTGPYAARGPGQTASRNKIFVCHPGPEATIHRETDCARTILSGLARQAYRRPVSDEEIERLLRLFRNGQEESFESGIELALQGILAGPEFLFRVEQDPPGVEPGEAYALSDLELASRLSFFLWSSLPDAELLRVAEQGRLTDSQVLERQVRRMIDDPRFSQGFIRNFGEQWLGIRQVELADPNLDIFPEFDDELREAFKQELRLWFANMVKQDRSVLELMTANTTFVNERLARHYGIPEVYGSRFRPVTLNTTQSREGLMGKGGFLIATAFNNRTSPVIRGKWVLENLLNMPPPPPPENVPALQTSSEAGQALTLKEAMEKHRANPVCASCHKLMDPIGFALENFDAIGNYRARYEEANAEVDASGILFDGSQFRSTEEFRKEFMKHSQRVVHTVTEKVLTYALGRGLQYYDQPAVREIVQKSAADDFTWSSLILSIIESMPFQYRRASSHDDI